MPAHTEHTGEGGRPCVVCTLPIASGGGGQVPSEIVDAFADSWVLPRGPVHVEDCASLWPITIRPVQQAGATDGSGIGWRVAHGLDGRMIGLSLDGIGKAFTLARAVRPAIGRAVA